MENKTKAQRIIEEIIEPKLGRLLMPHEEQKVREDLFIILEETNEE